MTRMLALIAALLMTGITVSSACVASSPAPLRFTIEPSRDTDRLVQIRAVTRDLHKRK